MGLLKSIPWANVSKAFDTDKGVSGGELSVIPVYNECINVRAWINGSDHSSKADVAAEYQSFPISHSLSVICPISHSLSLSTA